MVKEHALTSTRVHPCVPTSIVPDHWIPSSCHQQQCTGCHCFKRGSAFVHLRKSDVTTQKCYSCRKKVDTPIHDLLDDPPVWLQGAIGALIIAAVLTLLWCIVSMALRTPTAPSSTSKDLVMHDAAETTRATKTLITTLVRTEPITRAGEVVLEQKVMTTTRVVITP